ncbi:uncharacterized protein [Dendrobates tinctorius]|uniref:uncharacterized protein n=1 Tax=Dendrobates tinctorius TaxID=92724 RepID=UPI003CC9D5F5
MASADERNELDCAICLTPYTDPVTLRCGHNFCRVCIDQVLNTQDGSGVYSCPECREELQEWSALKWNLTLYNVEDVFLSTHLSQEITGICCTFCVDSPVPAIKSCLLCDASLCDNHLRVHSKSAVHVIAETSVLAREYQGHLLEMLDEAFEKKKTKNLRNVLQKLIIQTKETEEKVQSVVELKRKTQARASRDAERVDDLFIDIRRQMDDLEKRVLSEISRRKEQVSLSLSDVIQKLEIKKDELSRKMRHIEMLCNMRDPLTVLQERDTGDLCDPEEDGDNDDKDTGGHDEGDEDTGGHYGGDDDTGGYDGGDEDSGGYDGGEEDTWGNDGSTKNTVRRDGGDEDTGEDGSNEDTGGHDGGDEDTGRHDGCDEETGGPDGGDEDTGEKDGSDEDTEGHDGGDEDTGRHDGCNEDTVGYDGGDEDTGRHDGCDEETGGPDGGDEDPGEKDGSDEDTEGHDGGDEDTGEHDGCNEDTVGYDGGDEDTGGHDGGDEDTGGHDGGDRGVELISHLSRISLMLSDMIRDVNVTLYGEGPANILLDVNTADENLQISDDLKTVTWTIIAENHPETVEERFQYNQVMSGSRFTSGRHYWDVEIREAWRWRVGMCYPSIVRRGDQSYIGYNKESWGLYGGPGYINQCSVKHDNKYIRLPHQISSDGVRICLDYEAGQLSFYVLCDPIRHLHTFTAAFTEPLHAILGVCGGSIKISGGQV